MNKLFSKIASLSVGLALAVGVGVAVNTHNGVSRVRATEVAAYTLNGTQAGSGSSYNGDNTATQDGVSWTINGNLTTNPWRIGGNKNNGTETGVDRYAYSKSAVSTQNISKVVFTAGTVNITVNNFKLIVSSEAKGAGTVTDELTGTITASQATEFTRPEGHDWSSKYFTFVFSVTNATTTAKYVQFNSAVFYYEVSGQDISAPSFATVAVGKTAEVEVSYTNIEEGGIAVSSDSDCVDVPENLDVTGTGTTTLVIEGVSEDIATVTLSAGTASVDITVQVINPEYFYKVDNILNLTNGSKFTLVAESGGKLYYPYGFNSGGYYETKEVSVSGEGCVGMEDAVEFTIEYVGANIYIMDGDKYVTTSSVSNTAKIALSDDRDVDYADYVASQDLDTGKVAIDFNTTDGTSRRVNYQPSNGRIANYSVNSASLLYIYASELKPSVIVADLELELKDDSSASSNFYCLNFGEEEVTVTATSGNEDVCTAAINGSKLEVTGVGAGETTVTVSAKSTSFGPVTCVVSVKVTSSARTLTSLTLSVSEETLYKGQEFYYSGVITANYDNGDEVVLEHSQVEFSGYSMDEVDDYTVTVSYTDTVTVEETYSLSVVQWEGELDLGHYYVVTSQYTDKEVSYKQALVGVVSNLGVAAEYDSTLRSEFALLVEEGSTYNSYAFKVGTGKYLSASNGNNLHASATEVSDASSWTVTISDGNYVIANVAYPTRSIQCNHNNGNPRFAAYASTQKAVAMEEVSYTDVVAHFMTNFLHPEIEIDDERDTGACRGESGYYALAKAAFNVMPAASREFFLTSTVYANYKARLEAWAKANGEEFDSNNMLVANSSAIIDFGASTSENTTMIIIVAIAATSAIALGALLVIKKKKHN